MASPPPFFPIFWPTPERTTYLAARKAITDRFLDAIVPVFTVFLPFFTQGEATLLRLVCRELHAGVATHKWGLVGWRLERDDYIFLNSDIRRSVGDWRACFPRATAATFCSHDERVKLTDANFAHFRGLRHLSVFSRPSTSLTDRAFAHLSGIHTLILRGMTLCEVTNAAFKFLRGIHTLEIQECEFNISDAAFKPLAGIHTLRLGACNGTNLSCRIFKYLKGIYELLLGCSIPVITDKALCYLRGIQKFEVWRSSGFTSDGFGAALLGVQSLEVADCELSDAAFEHFGGTYLNIQNCTVTGDFFASICGDKTLHLELAECESLNSASFAALPLRVNRLDISQNPHLSDEIFASGMPGVRELFISECTGISGSGLRRLTRLSSLSLYDCPGIAASAFTRLVHLEVLRINHTHIGASLSHLTSLRELSVTRGPAHAPRRWILTEAFLSQLPRSLQQLCLSGCDTKGVSPQLWVDLGRQCPLLRNVTVF